jgi:small subunit ribosomal protein S16
LARRGTTKRPFYSIVVAEKSAARDGKFIERIGHYSPLAKDDKSKLDVDKARSWIARGARPTDRVVKLLKLHGIEVPAHLMDKQMPSAGKQKVIEARAAERKQKEEARAREAAARAKAKEPAGEAQPTAE